MVNTSHLDTTHNLKPQDRWLTGLLEEIDFQIRGSDRRHRDSNFNWKWFSQLPTAHFIDTKRIIKKVIAQITHKPPKGYNIEWLKENYRVLWQTRELLEDQFSQKQYDDSLVLKIVGYRRKYFAPENYTEYISLKDKPTLLREDSLSNSYMGLPLYTFNIQKNGEESKIIATDGLLDNLNLYRQYFIERNGIHFAPKQGDVVLDCGACIGEISTVFAMHVGKTGQVHLFDPMPAHLKFCQQQKKINPHLANCMFIVPKAVGAVSNHIDPFPTTIDTQIIPNTTTTEDFPFISIDDYVHQNQLKVDVIKMDIEGGEYDALIGAKQTIKTFKPKLMISAYHRTDDLWKLREIIQELNPEYKFYFGHHTPIQWESVLYAI